MSSKSHILETHTLRRENASTGQMEEVEVRKIHKVKIKAEDEFFMLYIQSLSPFYSLKYADDIKLMAKLCEWADFNKGNVFLTANRRKDITEQLGIHKSNISASLKRLTEKKLIAGDKGEYVINPMVAWKGSNSVRMEVLKNEGIQVVFSFTAEIENKVDNDPNAGIQPTENI